MVPDADRSCQYQLERRIKGREKKLKTMMRWCAISLHLWFFSLSNLWLSDDFEASDSDASSPSDSDSDSSGAETASDTNGDPAVASKPKKSAPSKADGGENSEAKKRGKGKAKADEAIVQLRPNSTSANCSRYFRRVCEVSKPIRSIWNSNISWRSSSSGGLQQQNGIH